MPPHLIVNADFDETALTLTMFAKSRGLGDCGSAGAWAWDGTAFRLLRYQVMPKCAGILSEDWPAIYQAVRR